MAGEKRLICQAADLTEGANGIRFEVERHGCAEPAFVVRYDGIVRGFLNRCAHVPVQLDWAEGEFFDMTGLYLMCSTHGAMYEPESGRCVAGPCKGGRLVSLQVEEDDGKVYLIG
jgi:nitrite reductase/ring-hydroxylating ferredoxin subunit